MDFGTGDGLYAKRLAVARPQLLVVGVDANADALVDASRRAPRNALFARLSLDEAPGELQGVAGSVSVLLPWGSLLVAVATAEPSALGRLAAIGAQLHVVYGHGDADRLALPRPEPAAIEAAWGAAGLAARARLLTLDEVRALPTTWAKKLSFSGHARRFVEVRAGPTPMRERAESRGDG